MQGRSFSSEGLQPSPDSLSGGAGEEEGLGFEAAGLPDTAARVSTVTLFLEIQLWN